MTERLAATIRRRFILRGTVQGVGFRPFVKQAANRLGLTGWVRNEGSAVVIEVEGDPESIQRLSSLLEEERPQLARVDEIVTLDLDPVGSSDFGIATSEADATEAVLVTTDATTCPDCLDEIADLSSRRYGYPFTNCTNCGPRFTIVEDVPYDRHNTTMAGFTMCSACRIEYTDPSDRRFHAQPVCCPACGPELSLTDSAGTVLSGDPLEAAAGLLCDGKVVAIKGLGGYHLAALASSQAAVSRLRLRKHREDKPFAVMAASVEAVLALCEVGEMDLELLEDVARPIVLLKRIPDAAIASATAPHTGEVGVMLPYTPLHTLLLAAVGEAIVLTSGNASDEPIAYDDGDARERLAHVADAFLAHDRPIRTRTDDSVIRTIAGKPMMIRRSRGYVPSPIRLPIPAQRTVLACGAELKNTVTLASGDRAILSHHIGDLKNARTYEAFEDAVDHFQRLFRLVPEVVVHDLHPGYLSTAAALKMDGVDLMAVQHHHAHIAACMVDNEYVKPVIGVAFDGLGLGSDGTLWGGEFMIADLKSFERLGSFESMPLLGGDAVMREPWRMAAAYLDHLGEATSSDIEVAKRQVRWDDLLALAHSDVAVPTTTSVGRLFDAVASLIGVRDVVNYEGQAPVELEQLVDSEERAAYVAAIDGDRTFTIRGSELFASALADHRSGVGPALIAARFHNGLAETVVSGVDRVRENGGPDTVALSGGVFLNKVLLTAVIGGLEQRGIRVLRHSRVPPNDGCISLGQAAIAAARDASS